MMSGFEFGGFPWLPMILMMVVTWGGLFAGLWWLFARRSGARPEPASPTRILNERYARGEIDEHEWRVRRAQLHDVAER